MKNTSKRYPQRDPEEAVRIIDRIRREAHRRSGPTKGMTKEEALRAIKKTREDLWRQHLESRP